MTLPDPQTCHAAMLHRDRAFDGVFFIGVTSTGIFCRPVCPARTPKFENCTFHASAAAAAAAGFRACKRCRPETAPGSPAWIGSAASVARALKLIDAGALDATDAPVPVEALGDRLGLGARQVRRLFARDLGVSPVAVAQAKRLAVAVRLIDETTLPMAEVALAAGFGSVRRFNEVFAAVHGETPAARRKRQIGASAMHLTLSRYPAPMAELLLVTDGEGHLRALDFSDYEERMHRLLARHYGQFTLVPGDAPVAITAALTAYFAGDLSALDNIPVATGGTAFQRSVWAALRRIPAGATQGYGALAAAIGKPGAARAVGLANGSNPVGIVVPCHRVIGASGALTGYAGGVERKRWLLAHEGAGQV
ncbi:bifunctional transcriptional activator/DNA repair enzyme AdaA [Novosphingobium sp. PASSN1]|uniref:bifunctional transcriptional activator/DNA repair enzyme AdaA n=1 Tax=Novosphingobium sp. PASSN1 TaxID=2015561 RepID=UPI0025E08D74|nr:methylated-DNA--[protein]-cysteine S-methyltransferase [Novosphingobium sp. PASSN1]